LTQSICGLQSVGASILWVNMHNIHVDKSKIDSFTISGALFEGLSIVEPFNFECWIGNRNDLALKVGPLALFDLNGFHGRSENGRLSCLFLSLVDFVSRLFLLQSCSPDQTTNFEFRFTISTNFRANREIWKFDIWNWLSNPVNSTYIFILFTW